MACTLLVSGSDLHKQYDVVNLAIISSSELLLAMYYDVFSSLSMWSFVCRLAHRFPFSALLLVVPTNVVIKEHIFIVWVWKTKWFINSCRCGAPMVEPCCPYKSINDYRWVCIWLVLGRPFRHVLIGVVLIDLPVNDTAWSEICCWRWGGYSGGLADLK